MIRPLPQSCGRVAMSMSMILSVFTPRHARPRRWRIAAGYGRAVLLIEELDALRPRLKTRNARRAIVVGPRFPPKSRAENIVGRLIICRRAAWHIPFCRRCAPGDGNRLGTRGSGFNVSEFSATWAK